MTALAILVVTAGLAVVLAVVFGLAWPPVVVAILGTVPALYLAWLVVPGVISPPQTGTRTKPAYSRLAGRWDPVELAVAVIGRGRTGAETRFRITTVSSVSWEPRARLLS